MSSRAHLSRTLWRRAEFTEPTNDLDIEMLELLGALLADCNGIAFLVSRDRRFFDNVVTSIVAWEGDPEYYGKPGLWRGYEGSITDWLQQHERVLVTIAAPAVVSPPPPSAVKSDMRGDKEQRALDARPGRIEALEAEQKRINQAVTNPQLYLNDPQRTAALHQRSAQVERELLAALARREALASR